MRTDKKFIKKLFLSATAIALILAGAYRLAQRLGSDHTQTIVAAAPATPSGQITNAATPAPLPPLGVSPLVAAGQPKPIGQIAAPSGQTLRSEIEKDPHSAPESLLNFAQEMAPHMEAALTSVAYAEKVFARLPACVADSASHSTRAYCLSNAHRIAAAFPAQFETRSQALTAQAPDRVQTLTRLLSKQKTEC